MNQHNGFFQVDERLEREAHRDMDWQDKVVIWGCVVTICACILLMLS